jgi:hypothetical protein
VTKHDLIRLYNYAYYIKSDLESFYSDEIKEAYKEAIDGRI